MDQLNRAIFFDRDGVINYRIVKDYVKCPEEFRFIPDFFRIFRWVKEQGLPVFVVTNQQGVGKGLMTEEAFNNITLKIQNELRIKTGYTIDEVFYCTDIAELNSWRRKPNPGMLLEAQSKWNVDLSSSWIIGDSKSDTDAGKKAGMNTILVSCYKANDDVPSADYIVKDLDEALAVLKLKL